MSLCVVAGTAENNEQANLLASHLSAPVYSDYPVVQHWKKLAQSLASDQPDLKAALLVENRGLSLLAVNSLEQLAPVYIDFNSASWRRRLFNISAKKEMAAKALGLGVKKATPQYVLDTCAGFGQDLFVFSALGAKVTAFERSPLAYYLLQDALTRAGQIHELKALVAGIDLRLQDAIDGLESMRFAGITSVYVDPMFPEKKRHASVKKEMSLFQSLIGADEDANALFDAAMGFLEDSQSCSRVVIKRPKLAPIFREKCLSRQEKGKATRFDIYF